MSGKPSIVFCHGLWADGSCFNKVMGPLRAEGYEVIASEHGLDSLRGDVDCVIRAIGRVCSPVVLVGHSYGGTLITAAGTDDRVAGLVYICALAPDETETSQSQQEKFPATEVFSHIEIADGRVWLLRDGVKYFAGDLTDAEQELTWATAMSPVADLFTQKIDGVAWSVPQLSGWARRRTSSRPVMSRCSPAPISCSTWSARPPAPFRNRWRRRNHNTCRGRGGSCVRGLAGHARHGSR
jgi:pimeloyl-ACP methyl ester carboxylesterase